MYWFELEGLKLIDSPFDINDDCLFLDFGHGGSDPGCSFADGQKEKDYVLRFGLAVYAYLKPFFKKIYLSRSTDVTVSLSDRAAKMKQLASEFESVQAYSIHCNAYNKISRGTEWLLSLSTDKTHTDYVFCKEFLKAYCALFGFINRGIIQRESTTYPGKDYYYLHRNTPGNCKVKYLELFFGDNVNDLAIGNSDDYFNKATFFVASYILKRYGLEIAKTETDVLYLVQCGAFANKDNAENLVRKLNLSGFDAIIKEQIK